MNASEAVENALGIVPEEWLMEFCRLLEGEEPSDEFAAFFNQNQDCQEAFEMVLRTFDAGVVRGVTAIESRK